MEELKALTEKIVKDGGTPWCIGLGSGGATGWPATDWVEDLMLRTTTPENYDKWTTNELKFNDPIVEHAIDEFGWFAKNDKFVDGGSKAVASTDFRDSPKGLFTVPPKCYLHKQASFIRPSSRTVRSSARMRISSTSRPMPRIPNSASPLKAPARS